MISLKITLSNGREFNIRNIAARGIVDWIRSALMPQGVQLLWYQILPGTWIQVLHIQEIRELTEEEIAKFPVIRKEKIKTISKAMPKEKFSMLKNPNK